MGLWLTAVGLLLRVWAWRALTAGGVTLDQFMTPARPAHYTTQGPYRFLDHPAYWGSLLGLAGIGALALGWGGLVLWLPAWPLFAHRIHEENRLRALPWP